MVRDGRPEKGSGGTRGTACGAAILHACGGARRNAAGMARHGPLDYVVSRFGTTAMSELPACPRCAMENTYPDGAHFVCADCAHEWPIESAAAAETGVVVRDSNGNVLAAGDTVVVIKDLKVKGSSIPLKQGTVIRNIRLVEDDAEHIEGNSDKIKGLVLKTCFLKRA